MKYHIIVLIITTFIIMPATFGSETANMSKSERDAHRQEIQNDMYQKAISKDLGFYKTKFWKGSGDVIEVKNMEKGLVLMGGVLIHPSIQIEFANSGSNVNGVDFIREPKVIGLVRPHEYSDEDQKFLEFYTGFGDVRTELRNRNATDEEFIEKMREYIEKHKNYIEKVEYGEYSISVLCKNTIGFTMFYRTFEEVEGYPHKDPNLEAAAVASKEKPNKRVLKQQKELCECLEKDMVVYQTGAGNFKCIGKSFVQKIDQIIKPVSIDESKPVSDYLDTISLIIEELHKIGIYGSSNSELQDAAIILANWNRDPAELLKDALDRPKADAGK